MFWYIRVHKITPYNFFFFYFGFVNDFPLRCDMVFWIDAVFGYVYNTKTHMHKRVENFVTYKGFVWPHLCVILSLVDEKWQGSESLYVCAIILYLNFGFLSRIRYILSSPFRQRGEEEKKTYRKLP